MTAANVGSREDGSGYRCCNDRRAPLEVDRSNDTWNRLTKSAEREPLKRKQHPLLVFNRSFGDLGSWCLHSDYRRVALRRNEHDGDLRVQILRRAEYDRAQATAPNEVRERN